MSYADIDEAKKEAEKGTKVMVSILFILSLPLIVVISKVQSYEAKENEVFLENFSTYADQLTKNPDLFEYLPGRVRENDSLCCLAIKGNWENLRHVKNQFVLERIPYSIFLSAAKQDIQALQFVPKEYRDKIISDLSDTMKISNQNRQK